MTGIAAAGAGAVLALLAAGLTGCTSGGTSGGGAAATATPVALGSGPAAALQQQYEEVIRTVLPSVVQINTQSGTGSGVVYDDRGDIVTNAHVVGDATTVQVLPATQGNSLDARLVGKFAPDDLAVIRVTSGAGSLHPASFGRSEDIAAGQIVLAMGNPLGLTGSVTQGIISATGRTVSEASASGGAATTIADALQTSAAINGGNSGGALVNLSGQVVGIPTAAARDPEAGAAPGIGFAIPADVVTSIADQLISDGRVTQSGRAALGITAQTAASPSGEPAGVAVASVSAGGPAEAAGLRAGDVITAVDGHQTESQAALAAILATLRPGAKVPVTYTRAGASHTADVTLTSLGS
ncbi:MAG TPA: trypsin-like peptidase domain-containing protein [Trebonia sp.]|nr:trypsin-like peptidase domain-containing protein [Trebonia sp.]